MYYALRHYFKQSILSIASSNYPHIFFKLLIIELIIKEVNFEDTTLIIWAVTKVSKKKFQKYFFSNN